MKTNLTSEQVNLINRVAVRIPGTPQYKEARKARKGSTPSDIAEIIKEFWEKI
ncbi:MAG: hypothetical protein AAF191_08950 [Verrucomicrobiota bacterium]